MSKSDLSDFAPEYSFFDGIEFFLHRPKFFDQIPLQLVHPANRDTRVRLQNVKKSECARDRF